MSPPVGCCSLHLLLLFIVIPKAYSFYHHTEVRRLQCETVSGDGDAGDMVVGRG